MAASRKPYRLTLLTATVLAIAWGAFAFGAVYPWAYEPLAITALLVGVGSLLVSRRQRPPLGGLTIWLLVIGLAISVQLLPIPTALAERISPRTATFESDYQRSFGVLRPGNAADTGEGAGTTRPLSIAPSQTLKGLLLFTAFAVFFLGLSRLLSTTGALAIARPLVVMGILLAVVGIGQDALTRGELHPLIYGFWKPTFETRGFGPFVNPNHFAGWMLMVFPLSLAIGYQAIHRTLVSVGTGRGKFSVLDVPDFGRALTFGFSAVVMAVALLMTRSRSGLAALAAGLAGAGWVILRRQRSIKSMAIVALVLVASLAGAVSWAGLDLVLSKAVEDQSGDSLGGRVGAWRDTVHVIHDFPWTGSGFNTYGRAMTIYQSGSRVVHFQEAHNDYLQIAAEGGLLIGLPVLAAMVVFVLNVRRRFRESPKDGTTYWLRVGATAGLIAIALQSLVEFSLQMPGNAALFATLAAIAVHQSPNLQTQGAAARLPGPRSR